MAKENVAGPVAVQQPSRIQAAGLTSGAGGEHPVLPGRRRCNGGGGLGLGAGSSGVNKIGQCTYPDQQNIEKGMVRTFQVKEVPWWTVGLENR